MIRKSLVGAALTTAAVAAGVVAPSPALADMSFSKASGTTASTTWLEMGGIPNVAGNAHIGDLHVEDVGRGRARAFGVVFDLQCDPGIAPYIPEGAGHGEPVPDGPCDLLGTRDLQGSSLAFTIDRKLTKATLTGALAVSVGHGPVVASPKVNITWTGTGAVSSSRDSSTFTDEFGTYTYSYDFTGRQATIATGSFIGGMVFDDEAGETSDGQLGRYRSASRSRS